MNLVETGVASHAYWSRLAEKGSAPKREKRAIPGEQKQKMKNENGRTLLSGHFDICRHARVANHTPQKSRPPGWGDIRAVNQIDARGKAGDVRADLSL